MDLLIQDILDILHRFAPGELAEPWDNVGLLAGDPRAGARNLLVALDPTPDLIDQAGSLDANVIITHHPVIFHPLKALRTDRPGGRFLARAIRHDIHLIGCHTNLDSTGGGVSDVLAGLFGLQDLRPLRSSGEDGMLGLGRIGSCSPALSPESCIDILRRELKPPWLLEAGSRPETVRRIAVCGGSCGDFAEAALAAGADLFITAEIKHSVARWAGETGLWVIDGGHFATEQPAMEPLRTRLQEDLAARGAANTVHLAVQEPPLRLIGDKG